MKRFYEKVDLRSRKKMVDFLNNHFRYDTMNSWNCSKSFANNIKIYNLGLDRETENKLWDLLCGECESELSWMVEDEIAEFESKTNHRFTAGQNGRSGGYLVLYQMELVPSEYKSFCTHCGQRNFTSIKETGTKCGRCGRETRVDYEKPPMLKQVYPGRSFGDDDFEDEDYWDMSSLKDMVQLVQEFDQLCDNIVGRCVEYANTVEIVEEEILIPKTIKVARTI